LYLAIAVSSGPSFLENPVKRRAVSGHTPAVSNSANIGGGSFGTVTARLNA
jgi:hypothetical protein